MSELATTPNPYSGVIREISAAEAANLDERGIPKHLGQLQRKVQLSGYDPDKHTVTMAVSSSTPVERYFGSEILSHEKGAINVERLKNGIALLFNHNYDAHLGRSTGYELGDPLHVTCGFGTGVLATEKEGDVRSGILVDVSIGYVVDEWDIVENAKTGERTYTATKWTLLEVSLVTVPADPTVGVGRSSDPAPNVRSFRTIDAEMEIVDDEEERKKRKKSTEDDESEDDDEEDEDDEAERSAPATPSSAPSTTIPDAQRTHMEPKETTAGPDLVAQNADRVAGLRSLSTQYPAQFDTRKLQAAEALGVSVADASRAVFDAIIADAERSNVPTVSEELFNGMSERERSNYSIRNVYAAAVNVARPGTFRDKGAEAGFEREVSDTLKKVAGSRGITDIGSGIVVPSASDRSLFSAQQQRTIAAGGGAGTATNFTTVQTDPIELLRARTAVLALGARLMTGLHGAIQFPGQTGAASSSWLNEGSAVSSSDPTLGSFTMTPKRLSIANSYYRDFLAQSGLAIESFLAADRMEVLTRSLDTAAIAGSGSAPVPQGLLNWSGLAAVLAGTTRAANGTVTAGAGGVPMTFVDYNNMEATVSTANGDIGTMAWLTTPKVRAGGRSTPQIPGTASGFVWPNSKVGANGIQEGPLGYNALCTSNSVLTGFTANSVNNLHAVILAVWDQLLIGDWGLSEVIADPYTGAASALFKIFEHGYYDINKRHTESFVACTSALPS